MSRAKLNAAIKKTGGITSVVNTDSMESLSVSQIREEAYTNRSGQNLSPAEMAAQNKRRQTLLMKMGYDLVHIDDLEPHPENDYSIDEESIENLAATIKESGNTEALLVRTVPSTSKMQILAGERRWRAHRWLRDHYGEAWGMVPIRNLGSLSDEDALFVLHSDNLAQRILTPTERAKGFEIIAARIVKQRETDPEFKKRHKGKKTRAIIAEQFGVSETTVANELAISQNLSDEGKRLLDEGALAKRQAADVARMPEEKQAVVIRQLESTELDSSQIDTIISDVKEAEDLTDIEDSLDATARKPREKSTNAYLRKARNALKTACNCPEEGDLVLLAEIKKQIRFIEQRQADNF